jgi:hypothetical protein
VCQACGLIASAGSPESKHADSGSSSLQHRASLYQHRAASMNVALAVAVDRYRGAFLAVNGMVEALLNDYGMPASHASRTLTVAEISEEKPELWCGATRKLGTRLSQAAPTGPPIGANTWG